MIILLNQEVFDVGDPWSTLADLGQAQVRYPPSVRQLITAGQDLAYASRGLERANPEAKTVLAAMFGASGQANCALFLPLAGARSARDVAVRLADAPLTTMALLLSMQISGKLTPAVINRNVWVATGETAA